MQPIPFYKCLADETRLRCLLLILEQQELCVCELICALEISQPKVSRHLALLRKSGLLSDRRQGQWVFYRINPELEAWVTDVLKQTLHSNSSFIDENKCRLSQMGNRPQRKQLCCA